MWKNEQFSKTAGTENTAHCQTVTRISDSIHHIKLIKKTWSAAIPWAGELREYGGVMLFKNTVTTAAEEML